MISKNHKIWPVCILGSFAAGATLFGLFSTATSGLFFVLAAVFAFVWYKQVKS